MSPKRAHSKMVLRVHGMDESGVRFPMSPHFDFAQCKLKYEQENSPCEGLSFEQEKTYLIYAEKHI